MCSITEKRTSYPESLILSWQIFLESNLCQNACYITRTVVVQREFRRTCMPLPVNSFSYFVNIIDHYYMGMAAGGLNMEIQQFDWFINGRIFPVLPVREGIFKKSFACVE